MQIKSVLLLAALFLTATVVLYLSGFGHHHRRTRVFVTGSLKQSEAEVSKLSSYLQAACPQLVRINLGWQADYTISGEWEGPALGWTVILSRKGEDVFVKQGSPDAMESFRQACAAIRGDETEVADSDAHSASMPTGRYLLHSVDAKHVFLVDTKTGAVWQWQESEGVRGDTDGFNRVSVEGLYSHSYEVNP